jgi:hypothetical protein
MTAPTEEEIRASLARAWTRPYPAAGSPEMGWSDGFNNGFLGMSTAPWDLDDMRDSEIACLDELTDTALRPIQEECERAAIEALVGAMVRFAERYPDAPRAKVEAVA